MGRALLGSHALRGLLSPWFAHRWDPPHKLSGAGGDGAEYLCAWLMARLCPLDASAPSVRTFSGAFSRGVQTTVCLSLPEPWAGPFHEEELRKPHKMPYRPMLVGEN